MSYPRDREISPTSQSYQEAYDNFRWEVPEFYNIAEDCCDRHAQNPETAQRVALYYEDFSGAQEQYTFAQLKQRSDQLAQVLVGLGVKRGDRVGVLMPQRPETALTHLAAFKIGAITVPLTVLFRQDALSYRLQNSGAKVIVTQDENLPLLAELLPDLPNLEKVLMVGNAPAWSGKAELLDFWKEVDQASGEFQPIQTRADDPAFIVYTSGTTGNPKGALHAHRYLIGHLPGFEFSHDYTPQPDDCYWTPADWAWVGGLTDILLAAWHYGLPVVGYRGNGAFSPDKACELMAKYKVRNTLIPPTALKMMRQNPEAVEKNQVNLRTIASGGEALGAEILDWAVDKLGVRINEIYGQTEANYFVSNCQPLYPAKPGSMGRPAPGHRVAILDDDGKPLGDGEMGEVALHREGNPVFFLEYWDNPKGTQEKFHGDWLLTGDLAERDSEGYIWFKGRKDDVIISAGHRIGPNEIEEALLKHPAVALCAVVGTPDELRNHVVKAFIKPAAGYEPSEELAEEVKEFVKERLARHEYPREVEFRDELPLTTTGKIRRAELRLMEMERKNPAGK